MALPDLKRSLIRTVTVPVVVGTNVKRYQFSQETALATILTAGYFNFAREVLAVGDIIDIISGATTARDLATVKVTAVPAAGNVTVQAEGLTEGGGARAVVPTADGLTTGLIYPYDTMVEVTSANADHIITLPLASALTRGKPILIYVAPSTNCELRTPDGSNQTINGVDSDGTAEALLAHSHTYRLTQHLANGWLMEKLTNLGATATAVVPDA